MSRWWKRTTLEDHVAQHNSAQGNQFTTSPPELINASATATRMHYMPSGDLRLRAIYLRADTAIAAHTSNYWEIKIVSRLPDGRLADLFKFSSATREIPSGGVARVPVDGDLDIPIRADAPVMVRLVKHGSADNLVNLFVSLKIGLS